MRYNIILNDLNAQLVVLMQASCLYFLEDFYQNKKKFCMPLY